MTLSEFQIQKIKRFFKFYDVNDNNILEYSDVEKRGHRFAKLSGAKRGTQEFNLLVHRELVIWQRMIRQNDQNRDGKITLDEWLKGFSNWMQDRPSFEQYVREYINYLFVVLDTDKDRRLTCDEYVRFAYADNIEEGLRLFSLLDSEGKGYLSEQQLLALALEFFYGQDPTHPATRLWGMFQGDVAQSGV